MSSARALVQKLKEALGPARVTIVHPLQLSWYNNDEEVKAAQVCIRTCATAYNSALALLCGVTRDAWQPFLAFCKQHPGWQERKNPFDDYMQAILLGALDKVKFTYASERPPRVVWVGDKTAEVVREEQHWIAAQRMATVAGLSYLESNVRLSIHPVYGTWHSLRAVIIFDDVPYDAPQPALLPNPVDDAALQRMQECMFAAIEGSTSGDADERDAAWERWVEMRDAVQPKHPWRYSDDQIRYHYLKDKRHLWACVEAFTDRAEAGEDAANQDARS